MKLEPRKLSRGEKNLFFVIGIAVAIILSLGAWCSYVNAIPDIQIPTPSLPNPNAWDFYAKAGKAIIPANPPLDPAFDSQIVPRSQWKRHYPTARKRAWLRANSRALKLVRQGFKYSCLAPPRQMPSQAHLDEMNGFRDIARMLALESRVRQEDGDMIGGAQSALDVIQLGHDLPRGGVLIDYLSGCAINAIGRTELWKVLPHVNALEAKLVGRRLQDLYRTRISFADVLRGEKRWGQGNLLEMMKSEEWQRLYGGLAKWILPRSVIFWNYTAYMDALIVNAQKSFGARVIPPAIPTDPYNKLLVPIFERAPGNVARNETGTSLLIVALALRAYREEHQGFPVSMSQLVPEYLHAIPVDPYGAGEPLRYRLTDTAGQKYSLYSVGPDGLDNHGRAIENKLKTGKQRRFVLPESKGDIVAGVNF